MHSEVLENISHQKEGRKQKNENTWDPETGDPRQERGKGIRNSLDDSMGEGFPRWQQYPQSRWEESLQETVWIWIERDLDNWQGLGLISAKILET